MIIVESKSDLLALLDYFSVPPHRLIEDIDNFPEYEKQLRKYCQEFKVDIPDWLQKD